MNGDEGRMDEHELGNISTWRRLHGGGRAMKRPETKYAHSGDIMVAYQVTGEGNPIDLVLAPGTVSHLDLDWGGSLDQRLNS